MFRFSIRDVLWLTVVVGVALALWLGWSREVAKLRDESAALEAKLLDDAAVERKKASQGMIAIIKENYKLKMKAKEQEVIVERLRSMSPNRSPPQNSN